MLDKWCCLCSPISVFFKQSLNAWHPSILLSTPNTETSAKFGTLLPPKKRVFRFASSSVHLSHALYRCHRTSSDRPCRFFRRLLMAHIAAAPTYTIRLRSQRGNVMSQSPVLANQLNVSRASGQVVYTFGEIRCTKCESAQARHLRSSLMMQYGQEFESMI